MHVPLRRAGSVLRSHLVLPQILFRLFLVLPARRGGARALATVSTLVEGRVGGRRRARAVPSLPHVLLHRLQEGGSQARLHRVQVGVQRGAEAVHGVGAQHLSKHRARGAGRRQLQPRRARVAVFLLGAVVGEVLLDGQAEPHGVGSGPARVLQHRLRAQQKKQRGGGGGTDGCLFQRNEHSQYLRGITRFPSRACGAQVQALLNTVAC
mmetsp:Transcript_50413/g.96306  ORF Transcript_50413/g.96306 Transcript_50413/m.96306 type:complete len:209 (+) Transcript_50413:725-1351(+)